MKKKERILQLVVVLSLDQGKLHQHVGEEDDAFYERLMRDTNITDMFNGLYGRFKSTVSITDRDGLTAWKIGTNLKAIKIAVGE